VEDIGGSAVSLQRANAIPRAVNPKIIDQLEVRGRWPGGCDAGGSNSLRIGPGLHRVFD
jgi:hypothetical protein